MSGDQTEPLWVYVPCTSRDILLTSWDEPAGYSAMMGDFNLFGEPPFSHIMVQPMPPTPGRATLLSNFTGTRIIVEGSVNNSPVDPGWYTTCQVDGRTYTSNVPRGIRSNHLSFCDADNLSPDDVHTLNFTVHSVTPPVDYETWFNLLRIKPSPATNLSQAQVYIPHSSSINQYDAGSSWQDTENGHYTATNGSKVVVNFSGTSLEWYGFYDPSLSASREESEGTWQLDNLPAQSFVVPRVPSDITSMRIGNPHFTTHEVAPGNHRLEVTYVSTTGRPLGLHHLLIQNALEPQQTAALTPLASPSLSPTGPAPTSSGLSKRATIAISVNVTVVGLIILTGFLFIWHQKNKKRSVQVKETAGSNTRRPPRINIQTHLLASSMSTPSIGTSTMTSKGTPITEVPVPRGSLHIRSWNEETPPPYQQS
ncbi:hypothetical protein BJ165DRAFT_1400952 [Panaeolus papilionaceus]|nr:hypothetical protein BJ165DRAFT_1400952 [Panaeolus papilionaceus]